MRHVTTIPRCGECGWELARGDTKCSNCGCDQGPTATAAATPDVGDRPWVEAVEAVVQVLVLGGVSGVVARQAAVALLGPVAGTAGELVELVPCDGLAEVSAAVEVPWLCLDDAAVSQVALGVLLVGAEVPQSSAARAELARLAQRPHANLDAMVVGVARALSARLPQVDVTVHGAADGAECRVHLPPVGA